MCPGNRNLFKGAFQRILYLSIFRLLTGVVIGPSSVETLRLKMYPNDFNDEDHSDQNEDTGKINVHRSSAPIGLGRLREETDEEINPIIMEKQNEAIRKPKVQSMIVQCRLSRRRNTIMGVPIQSHSIQRNGKTVNDIANASSTKNNLSTSVQSRRQQVHFEANQISPLLQQCLGREGAILGKKQILKRTEPTHNSRAVSLNAHSSSNLGEIGLQNSKRLDIMGAFRNDEKKFKAIAAERRRVQREKSHALENERMKILCGGRTKINSFANNLVNKVKKRDSD